MPCLGVYDKTLRLWDITTGDCVKVLNYQTSVWSCVVHLRPPHLYALAGLSDGTLEYRHLHTFPNSNPLLQSHIPPFLSRPPRPIPTPPALAASPLSSTPHSAPDSKAPQESEEVKRLKEQIRQLQLQAQTSPKSEPHLPASLSASPAPIPTPPTPNAEAKTHRETSTYSRHCALVSFKFDYSTLTFGRKLGEGGFGVVYQGTRLNEDVAIKQLKVDNSSDDAKEEFEGEVQAMARLRSKYIVQFYGYC